MGLKDHSTFLSLVLWWRKLWKRLLKSVIFAMSYSIRMRRSGLSGKRPGQTIMFEWSRWLHFA
jgi:hypothetical protein